MPDTREPLKPLLESIDAVLQALNGKELPSYLEPEAVKNLQDNYKKYRILCHQGHVSKDDRDEGRHKR